MVNKYARIKKETAQKKRTWLTLYEQRLCIQVNIEGDAIDRKGRRRC